MDSQVKRTKHTPSTDWINTPRLSTSIRKYIGWMIKKKENTTYYFNKTSTTCPKWNENQRQKITFSLFSFFKWKWNFDESTRILGVERPPQREVQREPHGRQRMEKKVTKLREGLTRRDNWEKLKQNNWRRHINQSRIRKKIVSYPSWAGLPSSSTSDVHLMSQVIFRYRWVCKNIPWAKKRRKNLNQNTVMTNRLGYKIWFLSAN